MSPKVNGQSQKPEKIQKMIARKKRKRNGTQKMQAELPQAQEKVGRKRRKLNQIDELPWTPIEPPDELGDFEGFYGLEEAEGVEVIKDENNAVMYRVISSTKTSGTEPDDISEIGGDNHTQDSKLSNDISEDEWRGIEDEILESSPGKLAGNRTNGHNKHNHEDNLAHDTNTAFGLLSELTDMQDFDMSGWASLELSVEVMSSLQRLRFGKPTQIQAKAIPEIFNGHDLIGKAPTGSGKTLAFGIPILEYWLTTVQPKSATAESTRSLSALVILPTRELAHQIKEHLDALFDIDSARKPVVATLTGGLSIQKQRRILKDADVVVATPGRLWQIISETQEVIERLRGAAFLVIDEADRLLGEGQFKELSHVINALEKITVDEDDEEEPAEGTERDCEPEHQRQSLIFSATFAKSLQSKLLRHSQQQRSFSASELLTNEDTMAHLLSKLKFYHGPPKFVDVNPVVQMAENIKEGIVECASGMEKDLYLYSILLLHGLKKPTLVFVNSIAAVRRLVPLLQNLDINAAPLHSNMIQKARLRSIERFSGKTSKKAKSQNGSKAQSTTRSVSNESVVLVATDVAARGLDIPNIDLILHYHLPRTADTYVHRSGRTARAESSGSSVLICAPGEANGVRRLVSQVHAQKGHDEKQLHSLQLDRRLTARLKERVTLAKSIADAMLAKEKQRSQDAWMEEAAEDLGVDLSDLDQLESEHAGMAAKSGKGRKRKEREKYIRNTTKAELGELRARLRSILNERVNTGVSARYLAGGGIDVGKLLEERESGQASFFLGESKGLGID